MNKYCLPFWLNFAEWSKLNNRKNSDKKRQDFLLIVINTPTLAKQYIIAKIILITG